MTYVLVSPHNAFWSGAYPTKRLSEALRFDTIRKAEVIARAVLSPRWRVVDVEQAQALETMRDL